MKHLAGVILTLLLIIAPINVVAHITNEKNLYEDIATSEAAEEILYLRSMNAIAAEEGVNLFRPNEVLTREDLAVWAINFNLQNSIDHHGTNGTHSPEEAVDKGLIDTIQGNATFEDVNKVFFNKTLRIASNKEITREEFAIFMGEHFSAKVDGKDFFVRSGLSKGPNGIIENVIPSENEELSKVFINGREYSLSHHPKIVNGPADEESLRGHDIAISYTRKNEKGEDILELIKIAGKESGNVINTDEEESVSAANENKKEGSGGLLTLLSIPLIAIVIWFISNPIIRKFKRNN